MRGISRFVTATLVAAGCWSAPAPQQATDLPWELRQQLSEVLTNKLEALLAEKNELGASFKQGSFSRSFHPLDESTYQVTFHQYTASADRLKTERFLLTLRREPGEKEWSVAGQELRDTFEGLVRRTPGDEQFVRFDSFSLERDGLRIEASNGSFYTDFLDHQPVSITVASGDLSFNYVPPEQVNGESRLIYELLSRDYTDKFAYQPEHVVITCSPRECESILQAFKGKQTASLDDLDPALRASYDEYRSGQEKNRREDGFSGFRRPWDVERRFCSITIKKKGADHFSRLTHDSSALWEVRFGASGFGTFLGYYSDETLATGVSEYELERRDDPDGQDYDLRGVRGTVELALEDGSTMTGDVTFTLTTKRALRELPFSIARLRRGGGSDKHAVDPSLVINSVQDRDGQELTWVRQGTAGGLVVLPRQVPAGSELGLRLQFSNRGAIYKVTPSYSAMSRSGWLPFVRFGDMIDQLDLTVKVPSRYETLGVGRKVSEAKRGEVSVTRWVAEFPVNFPTVIFGIYRSSKPGFDAQKSDGTVIPVAIHVDRDGMTDWNIRPKQLPPLAEQAANSLNLYREIFGVDYPFAKLDLVNDPLGTLYGQSPASIVYLGSLTFRGEGVLGTYLDSSATKATKSLVAHEVGHQWWGSLVCHASERNYWFVESLAEYSSALFLEALHGRKDPAKGRNAYLDHVASWRQEIFEADQIGSVQNADTLYVGSRRAAIYAKGPYAFHMLRTTFGDEKFFAFLRMLAGELAGKEIVTRDIQHVAEKAFGGTMEWFFDQWIRGVGVPEYEISYQVSRTEDRQYLVQGTVKQRVVVGRAKRTLPGTYYRGIVPISVIGRKNKQEYPVRLLVEGSETPFRFKLPEEPVQVVLNKYGEVLAHDVRVSGGT